MTLHDYGFKAPRPANDNVSRPGDPNGCADDLVTTTFAPLEEVGPSAYLRGPHDPEYRRGPWIPTASGKKFYVLDPRPEDVDIHHIARCLAMSCRYGGAVKKFYSTAEHSTLIARSLVKNSGPLVALCGLLHDAPEAYSGFGDALAPVKQEFPVVSGIEDGIWRNAIAPHFNLPAVMPNEVHVADISIRGNEVRNLIPMTWHEKYQDPLDVPIMYWSPAEAEEEFMATFDALWRQVEDVKLGRVA